MKNEATKMILGQPGKTFDIKAHQQFIEKFYKLFLPKK